MTTIDDRIVSIKFDNALFEQKIATTIASIDALSAKINQAAMGKGFSDITASANAVDLSQMANGVDNISGKFSAMGAVAFTAIQNITNGLIGFVKNFAQTDILGPIISGGKERAGNIEQAQFQFRGLGLNVDEVMANALAAVKGTAYGLGDAAKAAAQFGASGLSAGADMTQSLRAIAGAAAMTGTSYGEMAQIFTSSAATGKINNQDLMQFATRGLNAASVYGKAIGKTEAQVHQMATAGEIDYKSFAKAMDDTFGAHATQANETYSGSLANMHAALSRLGASYFGPEQQQQRDLFNAMSPVIDNVTAALQPLIKAFLDIRGAMNKSAIASLGKIDLTNFKLAIPNFAEGFKNAFAGVTQLFGVIKSAFAGIFPPSGLSSLVAFAAGFKDFTAKLKMGADTADKVKTIFEGFFSIISIGWAILKGIVLVVSEVFKALAPAGSGFLSLGESVGTALTKLKLFLVNGGKIHDFFVKLAEYIVAPIAFIGQLKDKIAEFFNTNMGNNLLTSRLDSISSAADNVKTVWDRVSEAFKKAGDFLSPVFDYIKTWFSELGGKIAEAIGPGDFNSAIDVLNVGLLGGIALLLSKFIGGLKINFNSGVLFNLKGALSGVNQSLQAMQSSLKAETLIKIAAAMALLTISIVALSMIDSANLAKALAAIAAGFTELMLVLTLLDKTVSSTMGAVKIGILAGSLIALALAMVLLAAAMKIFATMSWQDMAKGFAGVGGGLLIISVAMKLMPKGTEMMTQSLGLIAIGVALNLIATSMLIFARMSLQEIGKGLVGIGGSLLLIAIAMKSMPNGPSMILQSAGLVAVGIALNLIAASMLVFARMSWNDLVKGITGVGAGLLVIGLAMKLMPMNLPITATGILILSVALNIMALAIGNMGSMDIGTLAKGLGTLAATLLILVIAMNAMKGTPAGAAAMLIAAIALDVMANVIAKIGGLSIAEIVTGLATIAGVFLVLGLAGKILEPVIPAIMGLGIALALVGAGFALFGVGAMAVVTAFGMLVAIGSAGAKVLVEQLKTVARALPDLAKSLAEAVGAFVIALIKVVPDILKLMEAILSGMLDIIIKETPKIAKALLGIITEGLKLIRTIIPDIVATGFDIIMALLKGLENNIGKIIVAGTNIVIKFIEGIGAAALRIAIAAAETLITFLNGLASAIKTYTPQIMAAGLNVALALLEGILSGLGFIGKIAAWFGGLVGKVLGWIGDTFGPLISKGLDFIGGLLSGIITKAADVITWFGNLASSVFGWIGDTVGTIVSKGVDFITGLLTGITNKAADVIAWFGGLAAAVFGWIGDTVSTLVSKGWDFLVGLFTGLQNKERELITWVGGIAGKVFGWIGDTASKLVSKGWDFIQGLHTGLINKCNELIGWFGGLGGAFVSWIGDLGSKLLGAGKAVIQGLWDGMQAVWNQVTGWLGNLNPLSWFNDINPYKGHAIKNLVSAGEDVMTGLRNGMENGWEETSSWLKTLNPAETFGDKIKEAISQIPDSLAGMDEFNPVITPVLDLTQVQLGARSIAGYMGSSGLNANVSISQARLISTTAGLNSLVDSTPAYSGPSTVTFEQSIYAPKALSTNDIYRNTKSQIIMAKEELGIS